ncbi:serin endopeptidase [Metarhizium acridum CQMa 102]|uniref:Serin endopeptidase n=1 Tax=Metarhizium acridum (strain CQMa 102) TaxID=655827 RepID=E9EG57_METAQ|nr:serine endopeptidase [Metarhizium acridum CQMa 102]EFY85095.1 serin endopeptidase [Metarhizium acridum CQMa 102]
MDPKRRNLQEIWGSRYQVDKLHATGYTGSGIWIGVVDTGVSLSPCLYTPCVSALGGCFGSGCRVALGGAYDGVIIESNPMDFHGHDSIVASILVGYSKEHGFVGVTPN